MIFQLRAFFFLLLVAFSSCTLQTDESLSRESGKINPNFKAVTKFNLEEELYAHMEGDILGSSVVLDIQKIRDTLYGNGFNRESKRSFGLLGTLDTTMAMLTIGEDSIQIEVEMYVDSLKQLVFFGEQENGGLVDLRETYSNSIPLSYLVYGDTLVLRDKEQKEVGRADIMLRYLKPTSNKSLDEITDTLFMQGIEEEGKMDYRMRLEVDYFSDDYNTVCGARLAEGEEIYGCNWSRYRESSVMLNERGILTYSVDQYSYEGGAHPNFYTTYLVYDLNKNKQLFFKDIFKEGSIADIRGLINYTIRQDLNLDADQTLETAGFFVGTIEPNGNMYVNQQGIGFYYNFYEIAPYAAGSFDIFLKFEDIKDLIKEDSPIQRFIGVQG